MTKTKHFAGTRLKNKINNRKQTKRKQIDFFNDYIFDE